MSLRIGSSSENDIVFNSRKVSGRHAEIAVLNNGDILLKDKGSTNGTFVNNQPIQSGVWVPIRRGDLVRFADMELQWASVPQVDSRLFKSIYGIGKDAHYNEIVVNGNTVSDFHATLKIDKRGHAFIEDHSLNGTTVNGRRIASHQNIPIKRTDDVIVGGIRVNLKQYLKPDIWPVVLKVIGGVAAAAAVVALLVVLIKPKDNQEQPIAQTTPVLVQPEQENEQVKVVGETPSVVNPSDAGLVQKSVEPGNASVDNPSIEALMKATVLVYGAYYVDVVIKDNPFKGRGVKDKWTFGWDGTQWDYWESTPYGYWGTAFFISSEGELGTNRHVACPWTEDAEDQYVSVDIKTKMQSIINDLCTNYSKDVAKRNYMKNRYGVDVPYDKETAARFDLLKKSDFEISGHHGFLGIVLPGQNFSSTEDLARCQVIAESGDPKKDVAIIRMNSPRTPDFIMEGGFFRMENARLDETKIKVSEPLSCIGYPTGGTLGFDIGNGMELRPTFTNFTVGKTPDEYQFQVQGVSLGGNSGSPVFDQDRNLVGVLWGGLRRSDNITFICNIKHLNDLYQKHKMKK